jgi:hypothetical protein
MDAKEKSKGGSGDGSVSDAITDVGSYLNENFTDYYWIRDTNNCCLTSEVSSAIPVEMQSDYFPTSDINQAITIANVGNYTSYGGCGPIAAMGIFDYFSRYLGYSELINDPTNTYQRISLAAEVLTHTNFSIFGNQNNTLVWPWDYASCFNDVADNHGLSSILSCSCSWTLFGGNKENYWNTIVENIDQGIPVTLFTGLCSGDGEFSQHYTNIYGYDTWVGIPSSGGERLTKTFIKARLNWGRGEEYFCNADILDNGQVGLITYAINYGNHYSFYDHDFAEEFVNDSGGGQYFFYEKSTQVSFSGGQTVQTKRLRTSYIENQYLVLSPNRLNAGAAYLDIAFPHRIPKLVFDVAMWSSLEGAINEDFTIQYYDGTNWQDRISLALTKFPL